MDVTARTMPDGLSHLVSLPTAAVAGDLVRALGMPTAACLVLRGARPVPIDEPLADGDVLEVVYVASGG